MPDFTQLEIDIMRLLAQHGTWMTLDELCEVLEHLDGGSPHDRTRVHAALSYLTRSRYAVRAFAERGGRTFMLSQRGAAEIAARDQLRLDPRKVEIRLVALGEEFMHATDLQARKDLSAEYQRLHRRWMDLAGRDQLRLGA
jgi:hypothetical protein